MLLFIILAAAGTLALLAGALTETIPGRASAGRLYRLPSFKALASSRQGTAVIRFFTGGKKSRSYRLTCSILARADTVIEVDSFYICKLACCIFTVLIVLSVRFTNLNAVKADILRGSNEIVFSTGTEKGSELTPFLYRKILRTIGPEAFGKASGEKKLKMVSKAIVPLFKGLDEQELSSTAELFLRAHKRINSLSFFNWWIAALILISFWFPELFLIVRHLLRGSRYRKEVIKLENVFELLGGVRNFRTIDILKELGAASSIYSGHINRCMLLFRTDRQAALDKLKGLVRSGRFGRLVDTMRIYALTDKALALDILERNRLEREEQILMTAEEDVELLDIIAFLSVVPVLLELAQLIMGPMLKAVNEAFRYVSF